MRIRKTEILALALGFLLPGCNHDSLSPAKPEMKDQPQVAAPTKSIGALNVREFGAVGDGKADDTAAFQRALTAASKMGGNTVLVPAGIYVITAPVAIDAYCTLEGMGDSSVIKSGYPAGTNTTSRSMVVMLNIVGHTNVRIAGLVFDANHADAHVIRMENGIDTVPLIIENNRFVNLSLASKENPSASSIAISLSGGRTFTRNNYCDGAASDSFNYNNGWHLVENNIILNGQDGGIAFNNGAQGIISGNWIFNCDLGIGMGPPGNVEDSKNNSTTITGNTIEQCMLGIDMGWFGYKGAGAPRNWTITGNVFKNDACGDINYDGPVKGFAANGTITGNTSHCVGAKKHDNFRFLARKGSTQSCFARLVNCNKVTMSGNTVVEPQSGGTLVNLMNDQNMIVANNLFCTSDSPSPLTAILLEETGRTTVSGNRLSGVFDFFIRGKSAAGLLSLHINDNVGEVYKINGIQIAGKLSDSEIINNRFVSDAASKTAAIDCPGADLSVIVKNLGQ